MRCGDCRPVITQSGGASPARSSRGGQMWHICPPRLDRAGDAPPDCVMTGRQSPQRIERLTPLAAVLAAIDRLAATVAPYHSGTDSALRLTLAADVTVPQARPATALALRDGFAVRAEETLDA